MALALNNLKRVDMPLKTKKPKKPIFLSTGCSAQSFNMQFLDHYFPNKEAESLDLEDGTIFIQSRRTRLKKTLYRIPPVAE